MSTIFSNGFESGDFSEWTSTHASSGVSLSVTPDAAHHGGYGCRVAVAGGGAAYSEAYCRKDLATPTRELWGRFYLRLTDVASWTPWTGFCVATFGSYWAHQLIEIYKSSYDYRIRTKAYVNNPSPAWISSAWVTIEPGVRYCVETYQKMSDDPVNENGVIRFWVDGEEAGERTGIKNSNLGDIVRIHVPHMYSLASPANLTVDFDDVAVGDERIYPLRGYRVYHNSGLGSMDYAAVQDTRSEYVEEWTSSALAYPKTWCFGVRAYNEYGEEKNLNVVEEVVLLGSGEEAPTRPNRPTGLRATPAADGKVELAFCYDATNEEADCTRFHVYYDAGSGEVDYANPLGSIDKDDGPFTHYSFLSGALADGHAYLFAVRAAADDDTEDDGIEFVGVTADAQAPSQPASLSGQVVR